MTENLDGPDNPDDASDTHTVIKFGVIRWHPVHHIWTFTSSRRYSTREEARDRLADMMRGGRYAPGSRRVVEQKITYEIKDLGDGS